MRISFLIIGIVVFGCASKSTSKATLFLSNVSLDNFDRGLFKVLVDGKVVASDTIRNHYLSSHWKETTIEVPKNDFNLKVSISGQDYEIEKDTLVPYTTDSLKLFVRFNFYPRYKRYRNPEIYQYLPKETTRLKEIADSLYANNVLKNAKEYLNDTIPLPKTIEITFR